MNQRKLINAILSLNHKFKKRLILLNCPPPTQLAVASDGESSYAIFLYPEGGIEWIRGEGKSGNMGDARAQAGIISGEGINFIFEESGTDQACYVN